MPRPDVREKIYNKIDVEREVQDSTKWGTDFDDANTPNDWATYICMYVTDAVKISKKDDGSRDMENPFAPERYEQMLLKAGALCVAALETFYRNNRTVAKRHYD